MFRKKKNDTPPKEIDFFDPVETGRFGIPVILRCEIAGKLAAFRTLAALGGRKRCVVFCGGALNGQAGLVAARHLLNYGVASTVYVCDREDMFYGSMRKNYRLALRYGVRLRSVLSEQQAVRAVDDASEADVVLNALEEKEYRTKKYERMSRSLLAELDARDTETIAAGFLDADFVPAPPPEDGIVVPPYDPPALTREKVRTLDNASINEYGVPGMVLMENAGFMAARDAFLMLGKKEEPLVVVICGKGNNGGDGFVVARYLAAWGVNAQTFLLGTADQISEDAKINLDLLLNMDRRILEIQDELQMPGLRDILGNADLAVDALLGTGVTGQVRPALAEMIALINENARKVLAVDTPSGLDTNTGAVLGAAVKADRTVTFAAPKIGFFEDGAAPFVGELNVVDICIPGKLISHER